MPRILIVDDEPDVRELVETLLAAPDRTIEGADGGRAALDRLAAHRFDLVVSDLRMPDVDGIQIYRAIQQQPAPRPALFFMSGFTNAAEFVPFLREAGTPVVAKPSTSPRCDARWHACSARPDAGPTLSGPPSR